MGQEADWEVLYARFSKKEMVPIKAVKKLYDLNDSKFLRISALYGTLLLLMEKIMNNPSMPLTKVMEPAAQAIFNEEVKKGIEAELEQLKSQIDPKLFGEAQEQLELLNECIKVFSEHNKRGRPADPQRKRGRPKDEGIEKTISSD